MGNYHGPEDDNAPTAMPPEYPRGEGGGSQIFLMTSVLSSQATPTHMLNSRSIRYKFSGLALIRGIYLCVRRPINSSRLPPPASSIISSRLARAQAPLNSFPPTVCGAQYSWCRGPFPRRMPTAPNHYAILFRCVRPNSPCAPAIYRQNEVFRVSYFAHAQCPTLCLSVHD